MRKFTKTLSLLCATLVLCAGFACDRAEKPIEGHAHEDKDGNGVCDVCAESVTAELTFYAVNDLHGKFKDAGDQPGVDELTTYFKNRYADPEREEILLSSGDMWQGTVESSSNKGKLMTEWMNEAGFVSMTLGNHEYDWGPEALNANSEIANFPLLAINVTYRGEPAPYCQPSTVVKKGGVTVGIIGAIGDCLSSISGEFSDGLSFATGSKLTNLVKEESVRLREEEGCDFIVYSIHDGGEFASGGITSVKNSDMSYYDTSLSELRTGSETERYVDLVFEAHTHQKYILKDEHGVYHLQGGGENKYISSAEVSFNTVTKRYTVYPESISSGTYGKNSIEDDPIVNSLYEKYFPESDPYSTPLGYNSASRNSNTILAKVADLYYEKGVETWGKDYKIVLGGGYLNARSPYRISQGNVTYADLFSVLPFDNALVLGEISGKDLITFLGRQEDKSHPYTMHTTIKAAEVDSSKTYYIVVDTYTSTYGYNHIKEVARLEGEVYARDLLAAFIEDGGWAR